MNPGEQYSDFVTCLHCRGKRPRSAVVEVEGGVRCADKGVCGEIWEHRANELYAWERKQRPPKPKKAK